MVTNGIRARYREVCQRGHWAPKGWIVRSTLVGHSYKCMETFFKNLEEEPKMESSKGTIYAWTLAVTNGIKAKYRAMCQRGCWAPGGWIARSHIG